MKSTIPSYSHVDRKLTLSFGAVVLFLMLTAIGIASYVYDQLQKKEETRLSGSMAVILSESITRISFSGKYHARLLVEQMKARLPEVVFISVETPEGRILAHSDPARNDTQVDDDERQSIAATLAAGAPVVYERVRNGTVVKEVVLPYRGGIEAERIGVVRLGINVEGVRIEQRTNLAMLVILCTIFTIAAMIVVYGISRTVGTSIRGLAAQLQGVLAYSPLPIVISDRNDAILVHSVAFDDMIGRPSAGSTLAAALESALGKESVRQLAALDRDVLTTGTNIEKEMDVRLNGTARVWNVSKFPIAKDAEGRTTLLCTFIHDMTEHRKTEQALQESEERYRKLVTAVPDAIIRTDLAGCIVFMNDTVSPIFGIKSKEEVLGRNVFDFIVEEDKNRALANTVLMFERYLGPQTYMLDVGAGERHACEINGDVLRNADGTPYGMVYVVRDITERLKTEAERQKLQAQLQQAQKMESIGRLAGGVAHDFNNMLGVIIGYTELALKKAPPSAGIHQQLQDILKAAERSADLTSQLLAFARRQTVSPRVLDLNETVGGMLKMLRRLIGEDIELVWMPGGNLWTVKMDPTQIDQILANLVVNARDAISGVGGTVTIKTLNTTLTEADCDSRLGSLPGDYVMIAVSDNGTGMDETTLANVFEPFFTTKGVGKGTGLGLATVYGIIKQNNGHIEVQSKRGEGTVFRLYIPRWGSNAPVQGQPAAPRALLRGSETILLVEDETMILDIGKEMLESLGYTVFAASTPAEAVQFVESYAGEIHLLLTDVVMPGMNGRELERHLAPFKPRMKSLFMSGYTSDAMATHGILEDGIRFIQKPFTMRVLAETVRGVLDNL